MRIRTILLGIACMVPATAAQATDITFSGTLINSCILNLSTPGMLAAASDGTTMSSESVGGVSALLAVTAIGTKPTLQFGAPALTAPNGSEGSPVTSVRWQSLSGKTQAFTTGTSSASNVALIDVFTVNTKVENATGFASGNYTVRTTVTCQQS